MQSKLKIALIGDVIGRPGRQFVAALLPKLKTRYAPDVVIANGENSAGGLGMIKRTADELFAAGVDLLTGGNHIWDKKEALPLLRVEPRIARPLNFPPSAPGQGWASRKVAAGVEVTVVSLQGRVFMEPVVDNPFLAMDHFLKSRSGGLVVVDFHAEASAEKQALGYYLDGRVAAVLGTHTHVPTADLRILTGGTAYQTDVGMTGALDSVIGMKRGPILEKFTTGVNQRFEVETGPMVLDWTLIEVDLEPGRAVSVARERFQEGMTESQLV